MSNSTEENERYRYAVLGSNQGVWDWIDVNADAEWWSPRFFEILGYENGEITPSVSEWRDRLHPDDREATASALQSCFEGDAPFEVEYRLRTKSGDYCWVAAHASLFRDGDGTPRRMIGTVTDITETREDHEQRQLLELQLARAQRLDTLGSLTAGIAHDFNNMLTAINGTAEVVQQEVLDRPVAADAAQQMLTIVDRAQELTQQMLSAAGRDEIDLRSQDLVEAIRGVENLISNSIPAGVEIRYELESGLPKVRFDEGRITQALVNLVNNAAEACNPQGGTIVVRASLKTVHMSDAVLMTPSHGEQQIVLEVADDGRGMSSVAQSKIFDPFYTTKFSGRGLGLSNVFGIVKAHGASLAVQSVKGVGSTFFIGFPVTMGAVRPVRKGAPLIPPALQDRVIFLADDDPSVLTTTIVLLDRAGARALGATSAAELMAIHKPRQEELAVVVADVNMPDTDGIELCAKLRTTNPSIPIVLMTGADTRQYEDAVAQFPGAQLLVKPFRSKQLIAAMVAAIEQAPPVEHTGAEGQTAG